MERHCIVRVFNAVMTVALLCATIVDFAVGY